MELGEVGGEAGVLEPGVELAEGAGVGAAGVVAQRGVDQVARGRARRADRGLRLGDPSERILHVNGNYRYKYTRAAVVARAAIWRPVATRPPDPLHDPLGAVNRAGLAANQVGGAAGHRRTARRLRPRPRHPPALVRGIRQWLYGGPQTR